MTLTDDMRQQLMQAAIEATRNSHSPYSKFSVGAAVLSESGKIYTGANIENVSYGGTICAERCALVGMVSAGELKFTAMAVATDTDKIEAYPCGYCRQFMGEFIENLDTPIIMCNFKGDYIIEPYKGINPYPFLAFTPNEEEAR